MREVESSGTVGTWLPLVAFSGRASSLQSDVVMSPCGSSDSATLTLLGLQPELKFQLSSRRHRGGLGAKVLAAPLEFH